MTEYEIKSSMDGIVDILSDSFGLNQEEICNVYGAQYVDALNNLNIIGTDIARLVAWVLICSEVSKQASPSSMDEVGDEFSDEQQKCASIRVGADYVVVFSELKKITIMEIVVFIANHFVLSRMFSYTTKDEYITELGRIILDLAVHFSKSIKRLSDKEKCVFARLYELHCEGKMLFGVSDFSCCSIRKNYSGDGSDEHVCDYQTESCFFRSTDKKFCEINPSSLEEVFSSLENKGVIKLVSKGVSKKWVLVT